MTPVRADRRGRYVAAIDQGTTSSRCMIFDRRGGIVSLARREHRQIFPQPGWVEFDPQEIWTCVEQSVKEALAYAGLTASSLAAVGVTNQRETTVVWDRVTGVPVRNAVSWQDTRTSTTIESLAAGSDMDRFRERSGLPLTTYFSGPKLAWLLADTPGLAARAGQGDVLFGTMDSWLIWNLTGGLHVTDVTNASRTMLMNLATLDWDESILREFGIPRAMLPAIRPSSHSYGLATGVLEGVPVAAALGDQHAALFGQTAFSRGDVKSTYGTGSFLLLNTGHEPVRSAHGLLTTVAFQLDGHPASYALEGSIAVTGGLVQWFRDTFGLIHTAAEIETLAATVSDNGGCYIVPAFSGLFAPHWNATARGVITGLTSYVKPGHLARAALEATAWQTREVVDAMRADTGTTLTELRVDGGMTADNLLMQLLADTLGISVSRPTVAETTCLGAAYAAGLAVGYWADLEVLRSNWHKAAEWHPRLDVQLRERRYRKWRKAVRRSLDWIDEDD
ncbi:glycerol kinase GlpK [Amycolatopsis sp. QT-25]|uniref:glycerol kinase GlpK n=1 Tax=Amycolatopsis sp. QT-25 TaxID=3034022 RepID=UPI0023EB5979|nr:glycerol kinase GlpK [Amycolatopsis sp. QT-25]WET76254.1 glycerol kinase GlpK [Amycolatopsis sp. QT-25]